MRWARGRPRSPWYSSTVSPTVASTVLALVSAAGVFTIGYTAAGIQVVAAIAAILDGVWILMVSIHFWRDPALALP